MDPVPLIWKLCLLYNLTRAATVIIHWLSHIKHQSPTMHCVICSVIGKRYFCFPSMMTCMIIRLHESITLTRDFIRPWSRKQLLAIVEYTYMIEMVCLNEGKQFILLSKSIPKIKYCIIRQHVFLEFQKTRFSRIFFWCCWVRCYTLGQVMYIYLRNWCVIDYM